jgi:pyruvate dehydrogenase E1 component
MNIRPTPIESDPDSIETAEWVDSLRSVVQTAGAEGAQFLLQRLEETARRAGVSSNSKPFSAYRNSIPLERQGAYPGDLALEERLTSIIRRNALAMVARANKAYGELGGHIASYASAAEIFETGFNNFFRARTSEFGGDLVYFQPHSAPGVYARAFLEGRLTEDQLANYRQEVGGGACAPIRIPG